jgi:signal transduction histidine kinase
MIVDSVDRDWQAGGERRTIALTAHGPELLVWADPTMFEIVVRNLLDNARKYTPPGAPIAIEVSTRPAANSVEVRVIDQGPGIPPDQIEHIFDRFTRGVASSENWSRGYGLGLYLARELMKAHNGSITVENWERGAYFTLILRPVEGGDDIGDTNDGFETSVSEVGPKAQGQPIRLLETVTPT